MSQSLSDLDIEKTIIRYNKRFKEFGYDQKSVGWGIKGRQKERFKILLDILKIKKLSNLKVSDIGAGFGDLYKYMINNNLSIKEYYGYEIVPNLVAEGIKQNKKHKNFNLFNVDYLIQEKINYADISIMSGCFNFKLKENDNYLYIENVLKKAFKNSNYGIAANFITNRTDFQEDLIFYTDPQKIINMSYGISRRFTLDHSYFPYEFSIALFKDDSYSKVNPVFNDERLNFEKNNPSNSGW